MNNQILGDRYEVQQLLGKKSGRRTLLARDLLTDQLVVVKLLSFNTDFEWDDLKLFEREAETLKTLNHECIPRYLDYFEVNSPSTKGFALVQTYIPAQTLEQYLQSGRSFTQAEVKEIAESLLKILIYLHRLYPAVIHRDIKPSNILLGDRSGNSVGQVYLVDFGSVQTVAAKEGGTMTVVGTYGYMPPEQFGGRTTPASDLYSLGATLIYLVTGTHPADLPQKDLRIEFEHLTILSPELINWLKWLTQPSLERRPSSASQALAALESQMLQPPLDVNHNSLTVRISQPVGSKIKLTKDENALEILVPPVGFHGALVYTGLFAIAWNSFILFWTIGALCAPFPINIPFALFSLPFWGAGFSLASTFLFPIFGRTRLHLDHQQIALTKEFWGLKFNRVVKAARQHITKLTYFPRTFTTDSEGSRVEIPPQLIIWAGVHKYQLGGNNGPIQSEPEIEWLAHELSQWLGIPITRE